MKPVTIGLLGLATVLVGAVSYPFLLDVPWIRSGADPNLILCGTGSVLASLAIARKRSKGTIALAISSYAFSALFLVGFFVLMRLPAASGAAASADHLPDFSMKNQDGRVVSLASFRGVGPVMLVFYRGFW